MTQNLPTESQKKRQAVAAKCICVGPYEDVLQGISTMLQHEAGRSCSICGVTHKATQKSTG
jgi:hypothetical protein